jgi:hypothetical protein
MLDEVSVSARLIVVCRDMQRRLKKLVDLAQTRLEGKTRYHRLDKLMIQIKNLRQAFL